MKNKNLVGCCGIYCGACSLYYKSGIYSTSRQLKELLRKHKFNKVAVGFEWVGNYKEFKKWLNWLGRIKCKGCGTGGGNPFCSIRRCCRKKKIISCAGCKKLPCEKLNFISKRYSKWSLKNLKFIKKYGYDKWIKEKQKEVRKGFKTGDVIKGIKLKR